MINNFYLQIETELGPLSSDWFEDLICKASNGGHCPVADEEEEKDQEVTAATSPHTEDDLFRVPVQTQGLENLMFSTPRIFRQKRPQSPDLVLGRSPDPAFPWTDSSPCLYGSAKNSQQFEKDCGSFKRSECFGLLDTPKGSMAQDVSAKRISESLGAQLNPDLSWSSSFNTPSALSPTVILSKKEEFSPLSLLKDKEVIIVRKLFPSLSKGIESTSESTSTAHCNATLMERTDQTIVQPADVSFDCVEGLWRQRVPEAIKDGDVRNTVESVLDGADNVLSIFFSNSGSALRRVKSKERAKRVNSVLKEVTLAPLTAECSTDQTLLSVVDPVVNSHSVCTAGETKSPLKNADFTQWTPLSLSEIPDSKARQVCTSELADEHINLVLVKSASEQHLFIDGNKHCSSTCTFGNQKCSPDSYPERSQLRNSLLAVSPALTFSRKPRKFVYQVQSLCPTTKGRKQNTTSDKASHTATDDLTEKHFEEASPSSNTKQIVYNTETADTGGHLRQPGETAGNQVNLAALNLDHGLDMTQVCNAFAEDFTQEVNFVKSPNKSTQRDNNGFVMSICTTQTIKVTEVQVKLGHEKHSDDHQDFHSNHNETSGYPATFSDFSGVTASCSGAEHPLHPGFQTASNKVIFVPPEAVLKAKTALDELMEHTTSTISSHGSKSPKAPNNPVLSNSCTAKWSSGTYGYKSGGETADLKLNGSSEVVAENIPHSFLFQTNESGFRTASNQSISVSSANLEKAKDIFKDLVEESSDLCPSSTGKVDVQNVKNARLAKSDFNRNHSNHNGPDGNRYLTASQKADVTELCSILEEADSQYEFTQFRQAEILSESLDGLRCEKEWDADILSGIDFDDSFNYDKDRQVSRNLQARPNRHTSVSKSRHDDVFIQCTNKSKSCSVLSNAEPVIDDRLTLSGDKVMGKTLRVKSNTCEENESFSLGFKTAKGRYVNISEKYLSKARNLFADMEDCEGNSGLVSDHRTVTVEEKQEQQSEHHLMENSHDARIGELLCNKKKMDMNTKPDGDLCNGNTSCAMKDTEKCKQICGTANLEAVQGHQLSFGFSTAGGKELKVSAKSLLNARKLLNEVVNFEEATNNCEAAISRQASTKPNSAVWSKTSLHSSSALVDALHESKMSDNSLRKGSKEQNLANSTEVKLKTSTYQSQQSIQNNGFKMASGKGLSISAVAIQKSKTIFKDIDGSVDTSDESISKDEIAKLDLEAERSRFVDGFKMASGKGVIFSGEAFRKSKAFFKDCDPDCSDNSGDKSSVMDNCGFEAAVGNTVHLPEIDSLNKEALSLKDKPTVLNKYVEKEFTKTSSENLQSTSGCGFSTASGKMVSVSAEALQRAKAMLDDSNDASPCEKTVEISQEKKIPKAEDAIPGRSYVLSTTGERQSAISEKDLQKTTNICGKVLPSAETVPADVEQTRCLGFSTASGKGVVVSEKSLKEVKAVFAGCEDFSDGAHEIESHLTLQKGQQKVCNKTLSRNNDGTGRSETKYEMEGAKANNFGFSTASGKGVSVSKSALQVAFDMFRDCDVEPITVDQHHQSKTSECQSTKMTEKCQQVDPEGDQIGLIEASVKEKMKCDDHSLLNCHSLNLNGYTMTQQKYFEQEAMACTKALLEDDFNEHSLVGTLEDTVIRKSPTLSQQRPCEETSGQRKRTPDVGLTGVPPLKRRLISEFNQISDGTRVRSPVKSSPNGALRDRRAFKYNTCLKPNITHPSWNAKDQKIVKKDLQTSSLDEQKRGSSDLRAVVFVPPFRKPEVHSVHAKVTGVLIPAFKKDTMASDHVSSSLQNSSGSGSLSASSSACENKMLPLEEKLHTVKKQDSQDMNKEKDGADTEDRTSVPCEQEVTKTWQQSLELAQDMQDMRIRKKKRQTIRPLPGSFFLAKTSGVTRISLREAVEYKCPVQHTQKELYQFGVHCKVSQITAENAESFRFSFDDFFKREMFMENTGIQLADGGWLIPHNRGTVGKEEFYRALCDTPGVDPKLISEAWVFNHYRWIVWKRACMERAFPEVMGSRCLTPEQVLLQLKLRYDIEVDNSRRAALKKIIERDDTPAKTLVLCVCGIVRADHKEVEPETSKTTSDARAELPPMVIWLTDGWYCIKALLDPPLSSMLQKGRLSVGGKILIHGAELIGSQDACSPLEAPDSLMLKISANSTRRARWDSKLGFHRDPRPFKLPLSSLYPNGGVVGCVDIVVLRSYPTQWMEKKSAGVFVFRSERAEDKEARRHSSAKQKTMELLFTKIQAQFEKEEEEKKKNKRRRRFRHNEIENLQDGEELYEAMESDPAYVEAHLSACQMEAVNSYRRSVAERRQAEMQERLHRAVEEAQESEYSCRDRDITPVWKLAIADSSNLHSNCIYMLNIWRPSVDLHSLLREGCRYKAYYLATSETKKRSGTANVQFTTTKKSQFQDMEVCPEWLSRHFPLRQRTSFRDLQNNGFSSPCGEVDIVGCIISILDRQGPSPVLYLVDDKSDFVSVRCFSSLVQLALEDLVKPLALLAISNLQLRDLSGPIPRLYAGEQALFSVNPKEAHLQGAVACLKTFVQSYENFFCVAEEKLSSLIPPASLKSLQSPRTLGLASMPKPNGRVHVAPQQLKVFSPFTPVSRRTPTPTVQSTEVKDPKSLKRKRGIDYLSRVPSPPPLNALSTVASPSVKKTFNPPRKSGTPRPARTGPDPKRPSASPAREEQWVNDDELAMINTQALLD